MNEPILKVRNLAAAYGKHQVLTDIHLSINRGEWFSLLGPNASGKSTLLHCVSAQLAPAAGAVHIAGHDLAVAPELAKQHLGYAHPPERLPGLLTGRQCLEVYAAARELPDFGADIVDLAERFRLTALLDQFVDTYSLGTRQKLSVLLALMGEPSLIVLDEAFNGLDPKSALLLKQYLQERVAARCCAVLLATHALDIALRYSTRVGLLLDGQLVRTWAAEEVQSIRESQSEDLEAVFAVAAESHH